MTLATVQISWSVCRGCGHYDEAHDSCNWTDFDVHADGDKLQITCTHYIASEELVERNKRT